MRAVDRWAIEERGVAGVDLMERAGAAVARAVERIAPDGPVTVVCGKGNNGGDGLVVARLLRDAGRTVTVLCGTADGDAVPSIGRSVVVVDALLGTGFEGEPCGAVADAIVAINAADSRVVSVDVPSGVDASTGVVAGAAVRADVTVTFHAAKPGLWIRPGKAHAGAVETVEIGIPRGAPEATAIGLIDAAVLEELPRRGPSSTKFTSGHVLVAGGSRGLTGAPTMTARAAMRAGAGYVTACVPSSLQAILASSGTPELMTVGLADEDGALTAEGVQQVLRASERGGALALGPGLGRSDGAVAFARALARDAKSALVLDADGLNAHAGRLEDLAGRRAPTVLTPHAGEMARLLELDGGGEEVERDRAAPRARRGGALGGGGGAEGRRHARGGARRASRGEPRREPGARDGRHGGRADGSDRGAARTGHGRVRGGGGGRVAARARRQGGRAQSRTSRGGDGERRDRRDCVGTCRRTAAVARGAGHRWMSRAGLGRPKTRSWPRCGRRRG